jgi:hypothetical protein
MKANTLLLSLIAVAAPLHCASGEAPRFTAASGSCFEGTLTQAENAFDGDPASGDGSVHRGVVSLTITKRGAVSGRIRYNELLRSEGFAPAVYRPVVRAFAGSLKPSGSGSLKYSFTTLLGIGVGAGREQLLLEADYSNAVPSVTVRVLDRVSANASGGLGFSSETPSLTGVQSGDLPEGSLGRYVLTTQAAYTLVQTLPSGRLVWSTKMPGYSNTGSSLATLTPDGGVSAAFYEVKTSKSFGGSAVNSLIGSLNILRPQDPSSKWKSCAGDAHFPGALDWQSSFSATQLTEVVEGGAAAASEAPFCERGLIQFTSEQSCQWSRHDEVTTSQQWPDLAAIFSSGPAIFTLRDFSRTDAAGAPTLYTWNISYSGRGLVASGLSTDGVYPPALSLRLARDRGEITGFYGAPGATQRQLKGAALISEGPRLSASGWIEPGAADSANLSTWSIQIVAPRAATASSAAPAAAPSAVATSALAAVGADVTAADLDCLPPLILPPPLIDPPPLILPPPLIDPPPLILPPPLIDPPPLILPPPLIDPPPLILPPPLIDPPPLILPPPLINPPPLILPPPLIDPPPLILPPPLC